MSITVYGANVSPFVRKVRVILAEKNIPYELEQVNVFDPPEWFLEISPLKRIPVVKVEGHGILPDSSAICAYLEKAYPKPALYPADPFSYARALWYEEYADTDLVHISGPQVFQAIVIRQLMGKEPNIERAKEALTNQLPPLFDYLNQELEGKEYFVDDRFTIADIAVASPFINISYCGYQPDVERWPNLAAFLKRIWERPSVSALIEEESKLFHKPVDLQVPVTN